MMPKKRVKGALKARRLTYLILTRIKLPRPFPGATTSLCNFCKHAFFEGGEDDAELMCMHPLNTYDDKWESSEVWVGDGADCWGFRPRLPQEEAVDFVGCLLREEYAS